MSSIFCSLLCTILVYIKSIVHENILKMCRSSHALALTSRGELFGWGTNSSGQLGLGDDHLTSSGSVVKLPTSIPISTSGNEDIFVGIAAGYAHR